MALGVSLPMLNQPAPRYAEMARRADEAGFDSVWNYEFYRNPFVVHGVNAHVTESVQLGTAIATACSRTPFELANAAADVDELSGGRMIIGLSNGAASWSDRLNGTDVSTPILRIREYIQVMRMAWDYFRTEEPVSFSGRFHNFESPSFNPFGSRPLARPRIPIYLGALQPNMLRLAGEIADGVCGYLYTPGFVKDRIRPLLAEGAARSGRNPDELKVAALVICSVSEDREAARRLARINVGTYVAHPISEAMVEHAGLEKDRVQVLEALTIRGVEALADVTSDALLDTFSVSGTPEEGRARLAEMEDVLDHVILHTPYVPPITEAESAWAFDNTVTAFGRARDRD